MDQGTFVYMDHSATTPLDARVLEAMLPYLKDRFGNSATLYTPGAAARRGVEEARARVAALINADPAEIYFTSGGTESDNWAIKGMAYANAQKGKHVITSQIEHHAVLQPCKALEKAGFEVTYLPVDQDGLVSVASVEQAIRPDTILISVMFANNEVGTIEPVAEIGALAKARGVPLHTDAVQAVGKVKVDVQAIGCDLLSISAHKIYGPKGIGALYVRKRTRIARFMDGGEQENGRRAGTVNVPGVVGFGAAAEMAAREWEAEAERLRPLRDYMMNSLVSRIEDIVPNGHPTLRLPNNVSVCLEGVEGEAMVLCLDGNAICASTGSACTSGSLEPSHVLLAMGVGADLAHGSLRFTLGRSNTKEQMDYVVDTLGGIVARLRSMSPTYRKAAKPDVPASGQ